MPGGSSVSQHTVIPVFLERTPPLPVVVPLYRSFSRVVATSVSAVNSPFAMSHSAGHSGSATVPYNASLSDRHGDFSHVVSTAVAFSN